MTQPKTQLNHDESGLASILITMMLMLILGLIVMTFFRTAQREQRQALDRQLSTQAFYAAESGVNDAINFFDTNPVVANAGDDDDCNPPTGYSNTIDANSSYTCLLIDPSPRSLEYTPKKGQSQVATIRREDNGVVNELAIYWQEPTAPPDFTGCPIFGAASQFPSAWGPNCSSGILRIDLVPTEGVFSRADLLANTMSAFLVPARPPAGSATRAFTAGNEQGVIVYTGCTTASNSPADPRNCSVRITGLTAREYNIRLLPLYKSAKVTLCVPQCGAASTSELTGAQAIIDSTGKVADILRRIQVRIETNNRGSVPGFAIESSDTVCKRFSIAPPSTVIAGNVDPACTPL